MAQEKMDDWMQLQYVKDLARAERELGIEHWVYITFEIRHKDGNREVLHKIDIPRDMLDRWRWLIEWRKAKLVCKYPRKTIKVYHCFYDKRTGLQTGFDFILGKVSAAKAQITKVERSITRYIDYKKHNDLFFNIDTDDHLLKAYGKLEQKKTNYQKIYVMLQEEVKKHKENRDRYKLFIGFNKLGEFGTISEAKKHANESGLSGVFNLIGDKYQDSWYVSASDINKT
jgi:hypothetical protein